MNLLEIDAFLAERLAFFANENKGARLIQIILTSDTGHKI